MSEFVIKSTATDVDVQKSFSEVSDKKFKESWALENQTAINAYNKFVEEVGIFSDSLRFF